MSLHTENNHPFFNVSRFRLIIFSFSIIVVVSGATVYGLSMYHRKIVAHLDPLPSSQEINTKSITHTATTPTTVVATPTPTTPTQKPKATPTPTTPAVVVTPGSNSTVPSLTPTPTPSQPTQTTSYQSTNWSGYLSTGGNFTSVTGSWVAPTVSATSTTVESGDGTWIGIGGVTTKDLIQVGTENTISPSGVVTTSGFYELLPASATATPSLIIQPGDTISASIVQTTTNQWTISMSNVTTGRSFQIAVNYSSSLSSAEWIQEDPSYSDGTLVLLDNFGTVQLSNAMTTMNGTSFSAAASNASSITMIGQGGAKGHGGTPGALNGGAFTVSYH